MLKTGIPLKKKKSFASKVIFQNIFTFLMISIHLWEQGNSALNGERQLTIIMKEIQKKVPF